MFVKWTLLLLASVFHVCQAGQSAVTREGLSVKLVNGTAGEGRVEVRRNSNEEWGTVCDDLWGDADATVVCRMFGFKYGSALRYAAYSQGSGPIYMDNVDCTGNETSLANCSFSGWGTHNCRHYEDAGVKCSNDDVRLASVNGAGDVGAVEIRELTGWKQVCDSMWDDNDANVVCKQLGYVSGKALCCSKLSQYSYRSYYQTPSYSNFTCNGNEQFLANCSYSKMNRPCASRHRASAICYRPAPTSADLNFEVQIANSSSNMLWGMIQVKYMGKYGTSCANNWNDLAANITCKQKGQAGGIAYGTNAYRPPSPVWINSVNCSGTTTNLKDCVVQPWGQPTYYCRPNGVMCYSSSPPSISLVGGSSRYGVVQITTDNNNVGSICDNSWSNNDAAVVCKSLGFVDGQSFKGSYHGRIIGGVFMDQMYCYGRESSIFACRNKGWGDVDPACLDHSKDASVVCFNEVRLKNGDHSHGIVQIKNQRYGYTTWTALCGTGFGDTEARVVCREMGFENGKALTTGAYGRFYSWRGYIRKNITCTGSETSILNCSYSTGSCSSRSYSNYASVACYNGTIDDSTSVALEGGTPAYKAKTGRVVVTKHGVKGRICQQYWGDVDASVLCRQLSSSYRGGVAYEYAQRGSGPFWLSEIGCFGNESRLLDCNVGPERCLSRDYYNDAGVLCYTSRTAPSISLVGTVSSGSVQITYDSQRGYICADRYLYSNTAKVICKQMGFTDGETSRTATVTGGTAFMDSPYCQGFESSVFQCSNAGWRSKSTCNKQARVTCYKHVKLTRSRVTASTYSGQVQLFYRNRWTTVCGTGFGDVQARVACRELGYGYGKALPIGAYGSQRTYYSYSSTVGGFNCTGTEASLANCSFSSGYSSCRRNYPFSNYASIACSNSPMNLGFTVSIGNTFPSVVTVNMYGINGTICSDGWGDEEAKVICKHAGYSSGSAIGPYYTYGYMYSTTQPKLMSGFNCTGSERSLSACAYSTTLSSTCTSSRSNSQAKVYCFNTDNAIQIKLTGGVSNSQGIVNIGINNQWGTICDSGFSRYDAKVVCRQLGYLDGTTQSRSLYGNGTGLSYLYRPQCTGTEGKIWNCKNQGFNVSYSSCRTHRYDARVACTGYARLRPNIQYGAVQVFDPSTSRYGLLCADNFTDVDATVVCNELGYDYGISICCSAFGIMYGYNIDRSKISCTGREQSIVNCTYEPSLTYCPSRKYASVACSNVSPNSGYDIQIGSTGTASKGRVQISHMGIMGYICPDGFDDNVANVICKMKNFNGGFGYMYRNYYRYMVNDMRWLSNIQCSGTESSLNRCGGMVWGDIKTCSRYGDAAVYCYSTSGLQLRLNGTQRGEGKVQVAIDGVWGKMCVSYYSQYNAADVVCRDLGFTGGTYTSRRRDTSGGNVYISNVYCQGTETSLKQCGITWGTSRYCYPLNVRCHGKVRVKGFRNRPDYGRVEMNVGNSWIPVCDDQFTDTAAQVVCKDLGYADGKKQCCNAIGRYYGSVGPNITITSCTGTESSLTNCQYTAGTCSTGNYVTVYCSRAAIRSGNMQVAIESSNYKGAVNASKYGFYGPICDVGWTTADANVTCKQLGKLGGIAMRSRTYSSQPMVLGGFNCTGAESSLDNCPSKGFGEDKGCSYSSYSRSAAGVLCYANGGIDIRIINGTSSAGRVEIKFESTWGKICQRYMSTNVANVACRQLGFKGGYYDRATSTSIPLRGSSRDKIWMDNLNCDGTEKSLFECSYRWSPSLYRYSYRYRYYYTRCYNLGVTCYNDIRLTGGNKISTGSIEVFINNNWGSVCDHNWNDINSKVVCSQLGFDNGVTACCGAFGNHPSALMENVRCSGTESRLQSCRHDNPHTTSCYKHNVAVVCYKGTKPSTYSWRLGGGNNYTGEILVDYLGTTGRICSDGWDDKDARVACRALGFRNGTAYNHVRFDYYYSSNGPYWISNMACTGSERNLTECQMTTELGKVSTCSSGKSAGILCSDISGIYYRLSGGSQDNAGRVEVSVNGVWGSVCGWYFDYREANVFCRTLGYSDGRVDSNKYPNPTGPVYTSRFQCTGDEQNLAACPHNGWQSVASTNYYCGGHKNDVGITCYDKVRLATGFAPDVKQGPVQYYTNDTWTLICDDGFTDLSAKRVCRDIGFNDGKALCCSAYGQMYFWRSGGFRLSNITMACTGLETNAVDCLQPTTCESQNYASAICFNSTDVIDESYRYAFDQPTDSSGRIDVYHYGTKGRICSTFWNDVDAKVYCKKRGYPDGIAYHNSKWTYSSLSDRGPYWTSAINCTGTEPSLQNCSFSERLNLGNCSGADVAAAACFNETTGIKYRLAGGNDDRQGRVEISVGGIWGTVCDLFWDDREAGVLCRSLGYSDGYSVRGAAYGQGSGPIWLSGIRCDGSESEIHKCPHNGFSSEVVDSTMYSWFKCRSHKDDASVYCVDKVRLNQGVNASMGAVEIYHGTNWVTVCDDGFDDVAATIVCRTANYAHGVKIDGSSFGNAGSIAVSRVTCNSRAKDFSGCQLSYSTTCASGKYASVVCDNSPIVDDGFKLGLLTDSPSGNSGLLRVQIRGVWGSVCMAGIDNVAASVACRKLGYAGGVPYTSLATSTLPILMTDVQCNGAEKTLGDCRYTKKSKNNWCDYYAPRAGVLCYSTEQGIKYRITGDTDPTRGRLEMSVDGQWGAFCNAYGDSRVGKVACTQSGFKDGVMVTGAKYKISEDKPFWFKNVRCYGNETTITSCRNNGFNQTSGYDYGCRYRSGPVSVQCYNTEFKLTKLRLVGGDKDSGRVEVYLEGPNLWGTVCDDYWSDDDATVVCRQLGYATGKGVKRAQFGQGTGPIWLDNVGCKGTEMNIKDCPHNGFSVHNCIHSEDAGVFCSGVYVPPTTTVSTKQTPAVSASTSTSKSNAEKISAPSSSGKTAAIVVPIVLIVVVAAAVGGFFYYRRMNRFNDLKVDLVDEQPKLGGGVSLRPSGAFFSKFRGNNSSNNNSGGPGVSNPSYEFAEPSSFSADADA